MRKRWKLIETSAITIHKLYLIFQGFSCMEAVVEVMLLKRNLKFLGMLD